MSTETTLNIIRVVQICINSTKTKCEVMENKTLQNGLTYNANPFCRGFITIFRGDIELALIFSKLV